MTKPKHGGKRAGAGRATHDGAQSLKSHSVMLDEHTIAKARIVGFGNLSEGIRRAVSAVDFSQLLKIAETKR